MVKVFCIKSEGGCSASGVREGVLVKVICERRVFW